MYCKLFIWFRLLLTLQMEVDLGPQYRYHSLFACPILREQCSDNNPPVRLSCGHVISKDALTKLTHGNKYVHAIVCFTHFTPATSSLAFPSATSPFNPSALQGRSVLYANTHVRTWEIGFFKDFPLTPLSILFWVHGLISAAKVNERTTLRLSFSCPVCVVACLKLYRWVKQTTYYCIFLRIYCPRRVLVQTAKTRGGTLEVPAY